MALSLSIPGSKSSLVAEAQRLVHACRQGDRRAQETLYRRYYHLVLGVASRYAVDEQQARDYTNRAFQQAFRKLDQFRGEGDLGGWLRTVAVNICLGQLRLRRNQSYEELPPAAVENAAPPRALQQLALEDLVALIQQLPPVPRAVFNLTAVDGLSHREAALRIGISEANSRYHLRQARLRLQVAVAKLNE